MNGITVPKAYRNMLRNDKTKEYRIAEIRDYVKAHKGEVIKLSDLSFVGSEPTVTSYMNKLIAEGRITRRKVKNGTRGVKFTYTWHEVSERVQEDKHGEVKVRSLGFKEWPLGQEHGHKLMANQMTDYIESKLEDLPAEQIKGMLLFKKHINEAYASVETQRKGILEGGRNEEADRS